MSIKVEDLKYLTIGQQGENKVYFEIDMSSWVAALAADGIDNDNICCYVLFKQYGQDYPLIGNTEWDSETGILTWEINAVTTSIEGQGYVEIRALQHDNGDPEEYSGLIKKSRVIPAVVNHSISGITNGSVPAPYQDWVNQVLAVRTQLNNIFAGATIEYAISTSYTTAPTTGWDDEMPNILENKGKYLWTRLGLDWGTTPDPTYITFPIYIADDGASGTVTSVNGMRGTVTLTGANILTSLTNSETQALLNINEAFAYALANAQSLVDGVTGDTVKTDLEDPRASGEYLSVNDALRSGLVVFYDMTVPIVTWGANNAQSTGYIFKDTSGNDKFFSHGLYYKQETITDCSEIISATVTSQTGHVVNVNAANAGFVIGAPIVSGVEMQIPQPTSRTISVAVPFTDITEPTNPRTYPSDIIVRIGIKRSLPTT